MIRRLGLGVVVMAILSTATFTLAVNGTHFVSGAVVYFGYSGTPSPRHL